MPKEILLPSLFSPSMQAMESFFSSSERPRREDADIVSARPTKSSAIVAGAGQMGNVG